MGRGVWVQTPARSDGTDYVRMRILGSTDATWAESWVETLAYLATL